MSRAAPLILIVALLAGCETTQMSQPPNEPGAARASYEFVPAHRDPETGKWVADTRKTSVDVTNDGNPDGGINAKIKPDGEASLSTGGSTPLDWSIDEIDEGVLFYIGGGFIAVGIAFVFVPYLLAMVAGQKLFGASLVAGGAFILMVPWLGEAIADSLRITLIVAGLAVVALGTAVVIYRMGKRLGWFETETSIEKQMERLIKGDGGTAAAQAYLKSGGDKNKAKAIKAASADIKPAEPPPSP